MTCKIALCAALAALILGACNPASKTDEAVSSVPAASSEAEKETVYPHEIQPGEEVFTAQALPDEIIDKITGVSWVENDNVPLDSLSLLTLSYVGFDGKSYTGQMIVAEAVASDVTAIFKELYDSRYPIDKMRLIDDYGADDEASMRDNNCSAFCYRVIAGTEYISNHSYGRAVDINPAQNPYVHGDQVDPEGSESYLDREDVRPGMIVPGDVCYNAFISRGWSWGGEWTGPNIDFQHFEKM